MERYPCGIPRRRGEVDCVMIETITDCVRGCEIPVDDEGTVWVGATARDGVLCDSCRARLGWLIDDVADVAARARHAVVPGVRAGSGMGERVSGSRDPVLPFNIAALEACDLLVVMFSGWITYFGRELSIAVPRELQASLRLDRDVAGVRAGSSPVAVSNTLTEWGWWVKRNLPEIVRLDSVGAFLNELIVLVGRVERRFPRGEVRRYGQLKPRYCPVCEVANVWVTWQGDEPVVSCQSCGWRFENDWGELNDAFGVPGRC